MPFHIDRTVWGIILEGGLVAAGICMLWRLTLSPNRGPRLSRLGPWNGGVSDLLLFLVFVLGGVFLTQSITASFLRRTGWDENTRLVAAAAAFQLGLLLGIASFHFGWRRLGSGLTLKPFRTLADGCAIFLLALPIVYVVAFVWRALLLALGMAVNDQDNLELFTHLHSWVLRIVFSILAIVIAPIAEELIFRAGLFRFFRDRFPYWIAVLVPALLFGGAHLLQAPLENLPAFLPLAALGVVYSLAYERTGRIGPVIVAHSLFNLNTVLFVLAGIKV